MDREALRSEVRSPNPCVTLLPGHGRFWPNMKLTISTCVLGLACGLAVAQAQQSTNQASPQSNPEKKSEAKAPAEAKEVAVMKTSEGTMVIEFWPEVAPKTVENFKTLARKGFYDGTVFHRIMKGFMIQGGDPNTKDPDKETSYGMGGPGYTIKAEFNDRRHVRGVISMARGPSPDSAGSQFFICDAPAPMLDHQYTAFGKLIKGDDVLEKIASTPVVAGPTGEPSKPTKRVVVQSVKIVPADSVK